MKIHTTLMLLAVFLSSGVNADQDDTERMVNKIFAEGAATAGFYTTETLTECLYGIMYIDLSNEAGKSQLALAITAKATGSKIVRMNYTRDSGTTKCSLTGLHIQ